MPDAHAIVERLRQVPDVRGVAVWRLGDAPQGEMGAGTGSAAPGLLSAGVGTLEHVVESVGLGQIEEMWLLTDAHQILAIRLGAWQCVVTTDREADIEPVRDAVSAALEGTA